MVENKRIQIALLKPALEKPEENFLICKENFTISNLIQFSTSAHLNNENFFKEFLLFL
jgi:hypothetical protein